MATVQVVIIGLTIPAGFYISLVQMNRLSDNKSVLSFVYGRWVDNLKKWLSDQTKSHGTMFEIIEQQGDYVKLGLSDNPNGAHWTDKITQQLSDDAGLSHLWDKWNNNL
ncbi:hypothetical protein LCGC14_0140500 [marine sediment metagenome]|uniref:Uncharacterized protein n=1 Tax=marine sediment metagenome TaxID=412755 RepID=A0A0F9V4B3_9ZZZZ